MHARILSLLAVVGAAGLSGCLIDQNENVFTGPTQVEFTPQSNRSPSYTFTPDGNQNNYLYRRTLTNPTAAVGLVSVRR